MAERSDDLVFLAVCCCIDFSGSFTSSLVQDDGIAVLLQMPDLENFFLVCIPVYLASSPNPIFYRATAKASSADSLVLEVRFLGSLKKPVIPNKHRWMLPSFLVSGYRTSQSSPLPAVLTAPREPRAQAVPSSNSRYWVSLITWKTRGGSGSTITLLPDIWRTLYSGFPGTNTAGFLSFISFDRTSRLCPKEALGDVYFTYAVEAISGFFSFPVNLSPKGLREPDPIVGESRSCEKSRCGKRPGVGARGKG